VGARVGDELTRGAYLAILISFVATMIYLAWRFEWRFGLAAVIATAHDILTTIAFMKLLHLEISLTVVAALLTVLGYSLNATIIIFDRVRENLKRNDDENVAESFDKVVGRSVMETLTRSINTSVTVSLSLIALLIVGSPATFNFSLVLLVGVIVGTYSSILVAAPLIVPLAKIFAAKPKKD